MDLERMQRILEEFRALPKSKVPEPTFMEITGYPHYENVCSNILQFYLDPAREHRLGTTVLECLLSAAGLQPASAELADACIRREQTTQTGRIDILVETTTHLIGVENKIYAGVDNDIEEYWAYLVGHAKGRIPCAILLSLWPTELTPAGLHNFRPVTYDAFLTKVNEKIGAALANFSTRYLIFWVDFTRTMTGLRGGNEMDNQFADFFSSHEAELLSLQREMNQLQQILRSKAEELGALIRLENHTYEVKQSYWSEPGKMARTLVHDIKRSDGLPVAIDAVVSSSGWKIQTFLRGRNPVARLQAWLKEKGLTLPEQDGRLTYGQGFKLESSLKDVADELQKLIDTVAT